MIHQYKLGGYNIVLDVCSGSVHVVDDAAYDIIALMDAGIDGRDDILARVGEKHPDLPAGELGECQTSCQSACKTSCGIANQQCEQKKQESAK